MARSPAVGILVTAMSQGTNMGLCQKSTPAVWEISSIYGSPKRLLASQPILAVSLGDLSIPFREFTDMWISLQLSQCFGILLSFTRWDLGMLKTQR